MSGFQSTRHKTKYKRIVATLQRQSAKSSEFKAYGLLNGLSAGRISLNACEDASRGIAGFRIFRATSRGVSIARTVAAKFSVCVG